MKKIFDLKPAALLSAALLLSLLLTSCGIVIIHGPDEVISLTEAETLPPEPGPETEPGTLPPETVPLPPAAETADWEKEDADTLAALYDCDMEGCLFRIVTSTPDFLFPSFGEEEANAPVDVAKYRRNKAVTNKYNVSLIVYTMEEATLPEELRNACYSEDYIGDLIEFDKDDGIGLFAWDKVVVNLQSLPYTDYTAPYFDQRCVSQCSAGNYTFAVAGEANRDIENTYCVFYNKSLTGDADPASLVRTGDWTWDAMLAAAGENGVLYSDTLPEDRFLALACSGSNLLNTGYGAHPIAYEDRSPVEAAVVMTRTLGEIRPENGEADPLTAFRSGEAAFFIGEARYLFEMNRPGLSWGILPLPKLLAEQESYPSLQVRQTLFTAIRTMASQEYTGLILQALNAASPNVMREAFITAALRDALQSSDDVWMLRRLGGSMFCDFGYMISSDNYTSVNLASRTAYENAILYGETFSYYYEASAPNLIRWNPSNFPM